MTRKKASAYSSATPAQHLTALREQQRRVVPVNVMVSVSSGKPMAQTLPVALSQAAQEICREVMGFDAGAHWLSLNIIARRLVIPLGGDLGK